MCQVRRGDPNKGRAMDSFDFDLFVIGGGSGGVRAARMAAQRGARVALAEQAGTQGLGGTCVNVGCIPKKLYSYAAHYAEGFEESHGFGWRGAAPQLDWEVLKANRRREIGRLNTVYRNLLLHAGVTVLDAHAHLTGAHTVAVDGGEWRARNILVATGGRPHVPDVPGAEHVQVSDAMFDLAAFPQHLVVVGGGYVACEFASIFRGLGAAVTLLHRGDQVLRGFDGEVCDFVATEMRKKGIDLRMGADVAGITRTPQGLAVALRAGGQAAEPLLADVVLYATGRLPRVDGLGLEAVGVAQQDNGAIVVDRHYQTSVPSIHALGDVIHRVQLTPVALGEAMALVDRLFPPPAPRLPHSLDYGFIPTAVFTQPPIGSVGYPEEEARTRFGAVTVYRTEFTALRHTLSGSSERTLMKLVVDDATDRVVGLHMVGPDAGEIVQGFAVALRAGATKAVFDSTIGIHPTAAEEFVTMREPVRRAG